MPSTAGGLGQPASGLSLGVLVPVVSPCLLLLGYLFDFYFDKVNHRRKKKGNISLLPSSGPEQISTGTRKNGSRFSHKYGQTQIHLWGPVRSAGRNMIKHKTRSFRRTESIGGIRMNVLPSWPSMRQSFSMKWEKTGENLLICFLQISVCNLKRLTEYHAKVMKVA